MPGNEIFEGYDFIQVRPSCLNKVFIISYKNNINAMMKLGSNDENSPIELFPIERQDRLATCCWRN